MNHRRFVRYLFLSIIFFSFLGGMPISAFAYVWDSSNANNCDVTKVKLTGIAETYDPSNANLLTEGPYDSDKCLGIYIGENDDAGGMSDPSPNLGEFGDGLLNGGGIDTDKSGIVEDDERLIDPFALIEQSELQDANPFDDDTTKDDPGWIHLFNWQNGDSGPTESYDLIGTGIAGIDPLNLSDLINIDIECDAECKTGNWILTVYEQALTEIQDLLGKNAFDRLAISFKAGNGVGIYSFDFNKIFANEIGAGNTNFNPATVFQTAYTLSGTFDMADFVNKNGSINGISHINFWARDPAPTGVTVPEPSPLILLALGLLGIVGVTRRISR